MSKENYFKEYSNELADIIKEFPVFWDGKKCIVEMKENNNKHWKQMEWIGFYFEYLCEKHYKNIIEFNKIKYNNVLFDGFYKKYPIDFKTHIINSTIKEIILNDRLAIELALKEYKMIILIIGLGKAEYNDEGRNFKRWHDELKGKKSNYVKKKEKEGAWSRLRKQKMKLEQICFLGVNKEILDISGSFQKEFKNSNDSQRNEKVKLNLEKIPINYKNISFINFK